MAIEILKQVQENCPRDLKTIEDVLAVKSSYDTINEMILNNASCSYYATPLQSGVLPRSDAIVGFVASSPTTFTISIAGLESIKITLTKFLKACEFQFAMYDNAYPYVSAMFQCVSISNLSGSGYVIHANLDSELRKIVATSNFTWGDWCFMYGYGITKDIEISNLPKSPAMMFDDLGQTLSTHWSKYQ